jgi:hypothetical protein
VVVLAEVLAQVRIKVVVPAVELTMVLIQQEEVQQVKVIPVRSEKIIKPEAVVVAALVLLALMALQVETVALVLTHQFQAQPIH